MCGDNLFTVDLFFNEIIRCKYLSGLHSNSGQADYLFKQNNPRHITMENRHVATVLYDCHDAAYIFFKIVPQTAFVNMSRCPIRISTVTCGLFQTKKHVQ